LYGTGQFDLAITDLSEAVRLAPKHPIPRFNRAEVYAKLGFRDRAIEDYDAATQLDPHFSAAITASARLREQIGRHEQAIHDFDMAVQLVPGEVSLYYDRGNAKREAGDWRGALADYDRAVILAPRQAENYVARGWSRLGMGVEGADFDARAFLKLRGWRDPLAPYMAILGSMGARQFHRPADAGNILDEATANMSPRQWPIPVIRYLRGQASEDLLFQAAADARQKAEAHAFLGLDRVLAGDAEAGLKHLRAARDQGPAGSIAADVARAMLSRIEPKPPAPVVNVLPAPR
jgi:tetratricopeptide (TPR) repeat protein